MWALRPAGAAGVRPERTSLWACRSYFFFTLATSPVVILTAYVCASARSVPLANTTVQMPSV